MELLRAQVQKNQKKINSNKNFIFQDMEVSCSKKT